LGGGGETSSGVCDEERESPETRTEGGVIMMGRRGGGSKKQWTNCPSGHRGGSGDQPGGAVGEERGTCWIALTTAGGVGVH